MEGSGVTQLSLDVIQCQLQPIDQWLEPSLQTYLQEKQNPEHEHLREHKHKPCIPGISCVRELITYGIVFSCTVIVLLTANRML